jgi:endonuclease/exonuclease/phosphatase family metal-dependent hydrolase
MIVGCIIKSINMLIVSVHFPMELDGRKSMVKNFPIFLGKYKYDKLMICGDFNCFPDNWGYQQIPLMNAMCGTYSISQYSVSESTKKFTEHSFVPYPYDVVPKEALELVGTLDVMLARGIYLAKEGNMIAHDEFMESTNIHPSDHFCMSVDITWEIENAAF